LCDIYRFPPPIIPKNFNFIHKFDKPLGSERLQERPAPPAAQRPDDSELCKYIEGLASFVAKSGPRLEEISKEKQRDNPMFAFLFGGLGHDYYSRRLWEEEQKLVEEGKQQIRIDNVQSEKAGRQSKFSQPLGANERGKMLGEIPLPKGAAPVQRQNTPVASMVGADDRARLQSALSSTFRSSSPVRCTLSGSNYVVFAFDFLSVLCSVILVTLFAVKVVILFTK
jgi:G patch domain-containing protein 1